MHENGLPRESLLFCAHSLDGRLLWEQPLLLLSGTRLISVAALYCVGRRLHARGRVTGAVEERDLNHFWILNELFGAEDARLCNRSVSPRALPSHCPPPGHGVGPALPSSSSSSSSPSGARAFRVVAIYIFQF